MKGPEKRITDCILAYLRARPDTWRFKVGAGPWQIAGLPDVIGVCEGKFFAFEVKVPGKTATPLQAATLAAIKRAGGIAETVTSLEQAQFVLDGPHAETAEETIARLQAMVDLLETNLGFPEDTP